MVGEEAVERPAPDHPAPLDLLGLGLGLGLGWLGRAGVGRIAVGGPLEHVADHVVQAPLGAAGLEAAHGRGAGIAVGGLVEHRGLVEAPGGPPRAALRPAAVHVHRIRLVVPPGIHAAVGPARGELPLGLGRQPGAPLLAEVPGLLPGDAIDRVVAAVVVALVAQLVVGRLRGIARRLLAVAALVIAALVIGLRPLAGAMGSLALAEVGALA